MQMHFLSFFFFFLIQELEVLCKWGTGLHVLVLLSFPLYKWEKWEVKYSRAKAQGTSPARMWGPVVVRGDAGSPFPLYRQGHHPLFLATDELLLLVQKLQKGNWWKLPVNMTRSLLWFFTTTCLLAIPKHVFREAKHAGVEKSLWEIQTWLLPKVIQHNHPQNETLTSPDLQAVTVVNNQEEQRKKLSPFSWNLQGFIAPFTHPHPPFLWLQTNVLSHQARDHLGNKDSFYS